MVVTSVTGKLWRAFRQTLQKVFWSGLGGLLLGVALTEAASALWNAPAGTVTRIEVTWPPIFHLAPPTPFVHVLAVIVGLLLGGLAALMVAVMQTVRGVVFAAEHVDDVAGAVVEHGLDALDATVDALDGPNRHGFRGTRDPSVIR